MIDDIRVTTLHHSLVVALGYPFEGPVYSVYTERGVSENGFMILENVSTNASATYKRRVYTANRSGFYIKSEQSQSNIKNMHWTLYDDPALALTTWQWAGCAQIKNSWGSVRCVHFVFAVDTIFNLCVLFLVIFRNYQCRKIRIGDAFVSISDSLLLRGLVILAIWFMENFWQLSSLALRDGSILGASVKVFSFAQIMHGDLMSLYVSLAGLLGIALQERIDPALTILLFELGFRNRLTIAKWLPLTMKRVVGYAESDYLLGIAKIPVELEGFSPFGFWSTHHLVRNASTIGS